MNISDEMLLDLIPKRFDELQFSVRIVINDLAYFDGLVMELRLRYIEERENHIAWAKTARGKLESAYDEIDRLRHILSENGIDS